MRALILTTALLLPLTASAQFFSDLQDSPRTQSFELKFGAYTPDIDSETGVTAYDDIFGEESMFLTRIEYDYQFWQGFGSLAIGGEFGYGKVSGKGREVATDSKSNDETTFNMLPMSIGLIYHLDVLALRWDIPLVPFVKVGIDYNVWWITDGVDDTATFEDEDGETFEGEGDTWGYHASIGLKLLLDIFAPTMAQTFDNEVGVNNSYLFAEYVYSDISDFGSDKSFQLGDSTFLFGLAFEF